MIHSMRASVEISHISGPSGASHLTSNVQQMVNTTPFKTLLSNHQSVQCPFPCARTNPSAIIKTAHLNTTTLKRWIPLILVVEALDDFLLEWADIFWMMFQDLAECQQSQIFEILVRVVQHDVELLCGELYWWYVIGNSGYQRINTLVQQRHSVCTAKVIGSLIS